jgi:hypothetical protein
MAINSPIADWTARSEKPVFRISSAMLGYAFAPSSEAQSAIASRTSR